MKQVKELLFLPRHADDQLHKLHTVHFGSLLCGLCLLRLSAIAEGAGWTFSWGRLFGHIYCKASKKIGELEMG